MRFHGPSWRTVLAASMGAVLLHACTPPLKRYPLFDGGDGTGGEGATAGIGGGELVLDAGKGGPPQGDAAGICQNTTHKLVIDPPTVYFVLDRSGSMAAPAPGGGTRYSAVQNAAADLVKSLQVFIRAGAAVFPGSADSCAAGAEVFPPSYLNASGFRSATKNVVPNGGTPTAPTLTALLPKITALPGKKVLVLATDGAPNCNENATCQADECTVNIDGCPPSEACCTQQQGCCTPSLAGQGNCVDHKASVDAVAAFKAAGIKVYVIGIPGSQAYEKVLADMAIAGGAAVPAYPFYYKVDDLSTISSVLGAAAGSVISCDFKLEDAPEDPTLTSVYLDKTLLPQDPKDGWTWSAPDAITLNGAACANLHAGKVGQVQIVSECPGGMTQ
ncbi:putative secreted protein [Minicystis rosea]|nr:putative secreted protein [Minicystis rosea]